MFKKINLKNLLIIYFNLVVLTLISILIIFIMRGVDPKEDPLLVNKYLNDTRLMAEPFEKELNSIWIISRIIPQTRLVEELKKSYKIKHGQEPEKEIMETIEKRSRLLFKDLASSKNQVIFELAIILKNQSTIFKISFDPASKNINFEKDAGVPHEVKSIMSNWEKEVNPSNRDHSIFKISPSNTEEFLALSPIWNDDGNYFGMGLVRGRVTKTLQSLFLPEKTDEKGSTYIFNYKMMLGEKSKQDISFSEYFPELPKNFLTSDKSFFWDKNDNLFIKVKSFLEFDGGRYAYLVNRIPHKVIVAPLNIFKRKLILLTVVLLLIFSILNHFVITKKLAPLGKIVGYLNGATKVIESSSVTLNDNSTSWAESSMETSSGMEAVIISMEGFLKTFGEIKEETEKADLLSKIGSNLSDSIISETEKLLNSIKEISATSKKIEDINKIIGDISFQTNLLALNASVEAARAGEHGRGFAIVAESIRELADKTAQSTEEISKLVLEAWSKSQKGSMAATNSNEIFKEVVNNITQMRETVENINNSILGQYEKINPMKNGLSLLKNSVKSGTSNALKGGEIGQNLNSQALKLTDIVTNLSETISGKID